VTTAPALSFDTLSAGLNTTEFIDTPGISYDVTSDGMRLLLVKRTRAPQTKRIAFIRDWLELAERGTRSVLSSGVPHPR
jgi:hypothetical protein